MPRNQRDENLFIQNAGGTAGIKIDDAHIAANGTNTVTISNVAPSGVGTATIALWLAVDYNSTTYYIPMWT